MNELEVIRRECDALPGPDDATIAVARAALRAEIEAWSKLEHQPRPRPRSRRVRSSLAAAASLAGLIVFSVLVITNKQSPIGVNIAAAAEDALSPSNGDIVHATSRTVLVYRSKVGGKTTTSTSSDEEWVAGGSPNARVDRYAYPDGKGAQTVLTTLCGQVAYDSVVNLFTVSPDAVPVQVLQSDPGATYRDAYRHGRVHDRGRMTFHGIPAVRLVVTQYGAVSTMIVRRNNGYPLKTVMRRETARTVATYVTTYSTFEHLRRTPSSERLLQLAPHPGAFFVRLPAANPTDRKCRNFGSLRSLTERKPRPLPLASLRSGASRLSPLSPLQRQALQPGMAARPYRSRPSATRSPQERVPTAPAPSDLRTRGRPARTAPSTATYFGCGRSGRTKGRSARST